MTRRGSEGMALVVVVWILGLIATLGAVASRLAVAQNAGANLALERAHADLAIGAALDVAAAEILRKQGQGGSGGAGADLGRISATVEFENETARIDINKASEPLLEGMFASVGVSKALAPRLAAAVADWRDPDDETRELGAERLAYGPDKPPPRNGPFVDASEIGRVLGVTPAVAAAVQPLITVSSGSERIDAKIASRAVMLALPGVTPLRLKEFETALGRGKSLDEALAILGDVTAYVGPDLSPTWRVQLAISGANGEIARYNATLLISSRTDRPYDVLAFSEGGAAAAIAAPSTGGKTK